ncbi:MAG TPA: serine hydrolase domain-containing protein, partial [Candidatus Wallbacteria bacterium]|nr:serine hydrolase domain-containing protein [Candidatus Wallbacteria bacterium]
MLKKLTVILLLLSMCLGLMRNGEAKSLRMNDTEKYKNMITAARETIWKALTDGHGSCATVAVMDAGRLVYSECMGPAERASNRPVDKNTRFNIGSTSKMFVAVAILLLVDDGRIALDEPIIKYVPDFKMKDERYRDITVRMIFDHSSGLPGSTFFFSYEPDAGMHKMLLEEMRDASLKHKPGAMSMYCNDGFTLGEMIVERVSGKKYIDFLDERVFKPLGMKNTGASIGEAGGKNIAEYYDLKTGKKYPPEVVAVYACGGLSSTAEDLCKFGDSFNPNGHKILSDQSLAEIRRSRPLPFYNDFKARPMMSYFGWEYSNLAEYEAKGIQVLGKGGNTACYSTNLQIVPYRGISIGLIVNSHASGEALTRPILDGLMKDRGMLMPKDAVKRPVEPQVIPEELLKFAGVYVKDAEPFKIEFNKDK